MSADLLLLGNSPQTYTLDAWGQNTFGQLGENPHYFGLQQLTTGALSTQTFVQVESCGFSHFALTNTGNLYGWGNSAGIGSGAFLNYVSYLTPQLVLSNVAQFSILNGPFATTGGNYIVMAVKTDGTLWMTGDTQYNWGRTSFTYATQWNIWTQVDTVGSICQKVSVSKYEFAYTSFALLLKTDGTMWAIGNNDNGQLGQGNTTDNFATFQQVKGPGAVGFLTNVVDISAGGYTSYAVLSSGAAYGWGLNTNGEVGNGTTFPTNITSPSQVVYGAVVGGGNVSTAVKIFAWSRGAYITITPGSGPVSFQTKTNLYGWGKADTTNYALTDFWNGSSTTAALPIINAKNSIGALLPEPLTVNKVMGSLYANTAIITSGGLLLTWGGFNNNAWGQAGRSEANQYSTGFLYPTAVDTATNWSFIPEVEAATSDIGITVYASHMLAGKTDGKIYGTGANVQQSFGIYNKNNSPTQIGSNRQWKVVSSGSDTTLFINNQGELLGVGSNSLRPLGLGNNRSYFSPVQLSYSAIPWVDASTNSYSSAAINKNGILYAWGYNDAGECGSTPGIINSITQVTNYTGGLPVNGAVSTFMGGNSTLTTWCATFYDNGKVYTAGTNLYGQLGSGGSGLSNRAVFQPVIDYTGFDLQNVEKIWYCYAHAFVKLSVGDPASGGNNIFAWGDNSNGGLGLGSAYIAQPYATPSNVFNPFNEVTKIVGGDGFSIALYADGTVESTGRNDFGQLGNGLTTDIPVFQPVRNPTDTANLTDVVDIGATYDSAFAVLSSGDVLVWGRNTINASPSETADPYYGMLVPSNNTAYFTLPTLVANITDVYSIPTTPASVQSAFLLRNI